MTPRPKTAVYDVSEEECVAATDQRLGAPVMCEAISRRAGVHGAVAPCSGIAESQGPIERCSERRTLYHRRCASQRFFWFFAISVQERRLGGGELAPNLEADC